jgi:hypothetical protein
LQGGPDIWEVVSALNAIRDEDPDLDGDRLLAEIGTVTGLNVTQVTVVLRYYAAYPDEIDERLANNRDVAEREERLWVAQQTLLRRRQGS